MNVNRKRKKIANINMKKTALHIIFYFTLIVFISCQKNEEKKSSCQEIENTQKETVLKNESLPLNSYCFFKLDEKYSVEKDSILIHNWLKEKSEIILANNSVENIFSHNSGGPNGAEWNPSTDLYIAVLSSSKTANKPSLQINGKLYSNTVFNYNENLTWYIVEYDYWKNEALEIDSTSIKQMYAPEFLNGIKNKEFDLVADLNYGEILKFEISYENKILTKFFHATYGE